MSLPNTGRPAAAQPRSGDAQTLDAGGRRLKACEFGESPAAVRLREDVPPELYAALAAVVGTLLGTVHD